MKFNGTGEMIDALEFPITTDEIIADHGDHELELQRGTEQVGEILERLGTEEFDSPEDVRLSVRSAVGHKAIGRRFYSDRDPTALGESGPTPLSL
ncbi:DUF2795 domain-containing protein [Haloplanus salinus]|jgi:hypothetical protein|uniref:DUF2795 domain-containing protein n=1 Tax=Haloplanus salinus TaxID=1126245 RepID=A0A368NAA4_9EURY|nr:DUF2795 domain-containing protein [Haloplanus salinus]RCU47070.1 DUF2795 domain-containing protein [Haloplanus salinus]